jgi:hypothetical protein
MWSNVPTKHRQAVFTFVLGVLTVIIIVAAFR